MPPDERIPITGVTIRAFTPADYPALSALHNRVHPESTFTPEEKEREDATLPAPCQMGRIVAEQGGSFIGSGLYDQNPGMYHPHVFGVHVMVAPELRRRGIGSLLHARIVELLEPLGATRRQGRVRANETGGPAFAAAHGYREVKRDVMSDLDLERFDPSRWKGDVDAVLAQGFELLTVDQIRGDDAKVRAYYEQFSIVRADAPRSMPATPIAYDFFVQEVVDNPEVFAEASVVAFDGDRCVGFAQLWRSESSEDVHTGLTGVDKAYRRRGLATVVKVRSLATAKAAGAPRAFTDNDVRNVGMLAVNDALGFVRRPERITVEWENDTD